ncbi:MAG: hypothetical protein IT291_08280 [Deltaproteobacteria bacterium]|nr:hypothetical protein [Deltaproteobacteria bacterium]
MLHALVTDPNNENVIYAGCLGILGHDDKTIFRSTNGGDAWQTINNNLYQTGINAIAVNPHNSYVYVSTWGGIRKLPPPPSGSDTTAPNAPTGFNLIP